MTSSSRLCSDTTRTGSLNALLLTISLKHRVLVLKKLGDELLNEFVEVIRYLGNEEGLRVIVEPHEYLKLADEDGFESLDSYNHAEAGR